MGQIRRPQMLRNNTVEELNRWAQHTTDNIDRVQSPQLSRCGAYVVATFNVPTGTVTPIEFDTSQFQNGYVRLATEAEGYGLYFERAGYVQVNFGLELAASAAGSYRRAWLRKNGDDSEVWCKDADTPSASKTYTHSGSTLLQVEAGDIVQLVAQQDSAGNLAVTTTGNLTRIDAHYLYL